MPKNMAGVMDEYKAGQLHSGSSAGPVVQNPKQAIAIGLSEQRQLGKTIGKAAQAHAIRKRLKRRHKAK